MSPQDAVIDNIVAIQSRPPRARLRPPGPWTVETYTGRRVNLVSPDPRDIHLLDIAVSLSRIRRYHGHTREPYSVGAHCVWTARACQLAGCSDSIILHALLHDAHEAYIGDIPTPVKRLPGVFEGIFSVSQRLQETIYTAFRIQEPTPEEQDWVAWADRLALIEESAELMPSHGEGWGLRVPVPPYPVGGLPPLIRLPDDPNRTVDAFLTAYHRHRAAICPA